MTKQFATRLQLTLILSAVLGGYPAYAQTQDGGSTAECEVDATTCTVSQTNFPLGPTPSKLDIDGVSINLSDGHLMADAMLCSLRELANTPSGLVSQSNVTETEFGDFTYSQALGHLDFDPQTKAFKGYRQLKICSELLGCSEPILQTFRVSQTETQTTPSYLALDILSQNTLHSLDNDWQDIEITTPSGKAAASATFKIEARSDVILPPFGDDNEFAALSADRPETVSNVINAQQALDFPYTDQMQSGWRSQISFGNRDTHIDGVVWTGENGSYRPDHDLNIARTETEKQPSLLAEFQARSSYPSADDKAAYLPEALSELDMDFSVLVERHARIGVSGQLNLSNTTTRFGGDTDTPNFESRLDIIAGVAHASSMETTVGVDIVVDAGPFTVIDVHPRWTTEGAKTADTAEISKAVFEVRKDKFRSFKTLMSEFLPPAKTQAYLEQCLAEDLTLARNLSLPAPATSTPNPGQLFQAPYPVACNVCVYKSEAQSALVSPVTRSEDAQTWDCDMPAKNGCYDLCMFDPKTGITTYKESASQDLQIVDSKKKTVKTGDEVCYMEALIK